MRAYSSRWACHMPSYRILIFVHQTVRIVFPSAYVVCFGNVCTPVWRRDTLPVCTSELFSLNITNLLPAPLPSTLLEQLPTAASRCTLNEARRSLEMSMRRGLPASPTLAQPPHLWSGSLQVVAQQVGGGVSLRAPSSLGGLGMKPSAEKKNIFINRYWIRRQVTCCRVRWSTFHTQRPKCTHHYILYWKDLKSVHNSQPQLPEIHFNIILPYTFLPKFYSLGIFRT